MSARPTESPAPWVAGVDGCRAGWVVVLREIGTKTCSARVLPDFHTVLTLAESPAVIAVDVPIGLLDTAIRGGRACEVIARKIISPRGSTVFSSPTRGALAAFRAGGDHQACSTANRKGDAQAPGLAIQSYSILSKIAEVDESLSVELQARVREVHPELCFAEANEGIAMTLRKDRLPGRSARMEVLARLEFMLPSRPSGAEWDDLLDACIACWTAERIACGTAVVIPSQPPIDARGLRMELWR